MNRFLQSIVVIVTSFCVSQRVLGQSVWFEQDLPSSPLLLYSVDYVDENRGFVGTLTGELFKTVNGGSSWESVSLHHHFYGGIIVIDFLDDSTVIIAGRPGMSISYDSGNTWRDLMSENSEIFVNRFGFDTTNIGVLTEINGFVYTTTDAGGNWSKSTPTEFGSEFWLCAGISRDGVMYIAGMNGSLGVSQDSGKSWQGKVFPNCIWRDITILTNGRAVVSGFDTQEQGAAIYSTDDLGENWIKSKNTFPWGVIDLDFLDDTTGYGVGSRGAIVRTDDGGVTWKVEYESPIELSAVSIGSKNVACAVGENILLRTETGGTVGIDDKLAPTARSNNSGLRLYPNPAAESIGVGIENAVDNIIKISIYSVTGSCQLIEVIPLEYGTGRCKSVEIAVGSLPTGSYHIIARTTSGNRTGILQIVH